jgi:cytochrome P450
MTTPDLQPAGSLPWDAADPFAYYQRRRREGPVVWDDTAGGWLILGYRPAQQILRGQGWTSNPLANPNAPAALRAIGPDMLRRNILFSDGADHQRLRHAVSDVFTRTFIAGLNRGIESIADQTINQLPAGVAFDFMIDIALPLPIAVAAAWLGLGLDTAQLLRDESPAISRMLSDVTDIDALQAGIAALATLLTELLPLAAERRLQPADDLLSFLAATTELALDEVVTTAAIIAIAGHETTANLLCAATIRLLNGPPGQRPLDAIDDISDQLVTELLRLDGPVQAVARTATHDHIIADTTIHAGQSVFVVIAAANRDPDIFVQPDQLQPNRTGPSPITFGHGAHYCLGAALARLEIAAALRHLKARRPALASPPTWRGTPAVRGPQEMPTVFTQRPPRDHRPTR